MELFPKGTTIGEMYGPAMEITGQTAADAYFERLVESYVANWGKPREEAESVIRTNLGYYAGYYSQETRERVERLYRCAHPIFGAIATNPPPTAEQAFRTGLAIGQASRAGQGE